MPGPGGGSHGGGGFGGGGGFRGGGGGGFRGGGFGGGYRPRPFYGGFFGPRFYGGGCLGGLFSSVISLIVAVIIIITLVFTLFGSAFTEIGSGGSVRYDELKFQNYADAQYQAEFGTSSAYEDNILIVILTEADETQFEYIAWVGDHIDKRIGFMFGNEQTEFGAAINSVFGSTAYRYSMDSNLAAVVDSMAEKITALNLPSSFNSNCTDINHAQVKSHLTNKTDLPMTAETVNTALTEFTKDTGIPIAVVVESAENVFGRSTSTFSIVLIVILLVMVALIVIRIVRSRRARGEQDDSRYQGGQNSGYGNNQNNQNGW